MTLRICCPSCLRTFADLLLVVPAGSGSPSSLSTLFLPFCRRSRIRPSSLEHLSSPLLSMASFERWKTGRIESGFPSVSFLIGISSDVGSGGGVRKCPRTKDEGLGAWGNPRFGMRLECDGATRLDLRIRMSTSRTSPPFLRLCGPKTRSHLYHRQRVSLSLSVVSSCGVFV